jgi:glycerophosphoryl diester phosphodiesterase
MMYRIACLVSLFAGLVQAEPLIVAHRGSSHEAPENTIAAIKQGFQDGADFVEVDLRLTADERVVLMHDDTTRRTAGIEKRIAESTYEELKSLDVGSFKGAQFSGERIATVEECLDAVPAGKGILLELKTGPEIVPALARAFENQKLVAEKKVILISFKLETLIAAKQALPKVKNLWVVKVSRDEKTGAWQPTLDALIAEGGKHIDGLDLRACDGVTPELVRAAEKAKLPVWVWTVNDEALARQMAAAGVRGITTDRPRELRAWITP